jgi:hypothetical protein
MTTGIPTKYDGVVFRSRLEARWAAFFDRVQWPWEYEALELRGYLPDFILRFPHAPILAEVKPALTLDGLRVATKKIDRSGWQGEALVLGARFDEFMQILFGEIDAAPDGFSRVWGEGLIFRCLRCDRLSVLPQFGSWHCRQCGSALGNAHVADWHPGTEWLDAGNQTQWRPVN